MALTIAATWRCDKSWVRSTAGGGQAGATDAAGSPARRATCYQRLRPVRNIDVPHDEQGFLKK